MDLAECAGLLGWRKVDVRNAIIDGVELPRSRTRVHLNAQVVGDGFECEEADLNAFIEQFESEEPGRHPPVTVRRALLVEVGHRCAVCGNSVAIQFHHILEFSRLGHHDVAHMVAVCATCHVQCGAGQIDERAQREYKRLPAVRRGHTDLSTAPNRAALTPDGPVRFSWDDLREVIVACHDVINDGASGTASKYDFEDVDLPTKNRLNRLSEEAFVAMRDHHEPYFGKIHDFLRSPANTALASLYHEVVDELRMRIASGRATFGDFGDVLLRFSDLAVDNASDRLNGRRRVLSILLSFMYFNCDIGRKS